MYSFSQRLKQLRELGIKDLKVADLENSESAETKADLIGLPEISVLRESGFLCSADQDMPMGFALIVSALRDKDLHVFETKGAERTIQPLGDKTKDSMNACFVKIVRTDADKYGHQTTKEDNFHTNGLWFVSTADGKLKMWQIGIVTIVSGGYSRYYLSLQLTYQSDMYNDGGLVMLPEDQYPRNREWKNLHSLLNKAIDAGSLRPAGEYKPVQKENVRLANNQCEILWLNLLRRYGLARTNFDTRMAIVHSSEVIDGEFPALDNGQVCTFSSALRTPKGTELKGVKPIS